MIKESPDINVRELTQNANRELNNIQNTMFSAPVHKNAKGDRIDDHPKKMSLNKISSKSKLET